MTQPSDAGCGPSCTCGAPAREQFLSIGMPPSGAAESTSCGDHGIEQASIPAGTFTMGDSSGDRNPADGEVPRHPVTLPAFRIDATTVTNDDFARFVEATGYATEAETFGFSAVFHLALAAPEEDIVGSPPGTPWWFGVRGADWRLRADATRTSMASETTPSCT